MSTRSIILIGGPDSGKTNYIGRLWPALDAKKGSLVAAKQPQEIGFVLDTAEHLFQGRFAPRTEHADDRRDFEVVVRPAAGGDETSIIVPDISGELWRNAVLESEISADWMAELRRADGALLFVRIGSDQDVRPLDWVTSRKLLAKLGQDEDRDKLPTQVMLCELVRYLELTMANRPDGTKPRLSIVVSAWDRVDQATFKRGVIAYLTKEYPLFAGRLKDCNVLDVQVFGLSVVGGDLKDDAAFRDQFLESGLDQHGWVAVQHPENGTWSEQPDITLPVAWLVDV
ncbi:TRAFAC clade GTPase domain-containing protein [Verrucomicrobiota bacterium sgz303538]